MRPPALMALYITLIAWGAGLSGQPAREPPRSGESLSPSAAPPATPQIQNPRFPMNRLQPQRPTATQVHQDACRNIFMKVQDGLSSGDVRSFADHMAPQVYVNLRGGESGYYSANQAYYVLESYLKSRKLVNLSFSTIGESDARPYATGSASFVSRGNRELAQVYVSLTQSGDHWTITQINIY